MTPAQKRCWDAVNQQTQNKRNRKRREAAAGGGGGWVAFTLTAGLVLDTYPGYAAAGALGNPDAVGALSAQPNSAHVARAIVDAVAEGYLVQLDGDCTADLADAVLVINGEDCNVSTAPAYIEADDYTTVSFNSETSDRFEVGETYNCQIVLA